MKSIYLSLGEEIDPEKYLICKFFFESQLPDNEAAESIAAESSIGTWTDVKTMKDEIKNRLAAKVFKIQNNIMHIAYPLEMFESSIPQLLADIAGNIFGIKFVDNLRLLEVKYPSKYIKSFKGPRFGIEGVRKLLKIKERPLVGTIIKPKIGLSADDHARVAYEAWVGGCDFVKDDENLTNQSFNPFKKRVEKTLKSLDGAETKTGEKKNYAPNISAPYNEMIERAEFVKDNGGKCIMIDILTCGFSALQSIGEENFGMIIHGHRTMHGAITRNEKHGIHMNVLAQLSRFCGIDQLHIGTIVGKMSGDREEVLKNVEACIYECGLKSSFPVCSGGLYAGHIPALMEILGKNIIIQAGGGVHGHSKGTSAGATSMRQAVDAVMDGIPIEEFIKTHEELKLALEKWKR
ncbi:MAG: type III ribulose-bisphosphate carboxylase [Candidatus Helarchaeota archaeon]|nr:type III ribulose-bisphosphate carboxylase [Candidatus Helarchaeota archaeon]